MMDVCRGSSRGALSRNALPKKEIISNNVKPKHELLNILTKELPEMHKIVSAASVEKSFSNTRVRHMKTEHIH